MINRQKILMTLWDIWRAKQEGSDAIHARQQRRLQAIVEFARTHSPYYQKLYYHLPPQTKQITDLPPVTKRDLMSHFDDWVTDSQIRRDDMEAFIADPSLMGVPYLDRYAVWRTSGTRGSPGIFLHDSDALTTYIALVLQRGYLSWMNLQLFWTILRRRWRTAFVFATGGHFATNVFEAISHRLRPGASARNSIFSAHMPLADLVQALNEWQPVILASYPSVLAQLAKEQATGGLAIHPLLIVAGGECLKQSVGEQIVAAFQCSLHDSYMASEFMGIAFDCGYGRLHINADWVVLEPVDAHYHPLPPGSPPHTVLLTNLVNRIQPIIRYEMGDSVSVYSDACPCGSPLPSIRVEGRDDEILAFETPDGRQVELMPLPLTTVLMIVPGVQRFQLIQTTPLTLQVRLKADPELDDGQVWKIVEERLHAYLETHGLPTVKIERSEVLPGPSAVSAKYRHVWSELCAQQPEKEGKP